MSKKFSKQPTPSTRPGFRMLFAMDFKLLLPDILQVIVLAIMGVIQIRGIHAFYQDFTRNRTTTEAQPQQQRESPTPPAVPEPPVAPPVSPPVDSAEQLPPAVIRHYIRTPMTPEHVWTRKTGTSYHLYENCQYVRNKSGVTKFDLCLICKQRSGE